MKNVKVSFICKQCIANIAERMTEALPLYLDICFSHHDDEIILVDYQEDSNLESNKVLNFLEKNGYVVSVDSNLKEDIALLPKIRSSYLGAEYCRERYKHSA